MSDEDKVRAVATIVVGAVIYALNKSALPADFALEQAGLFVREVEKQFGPLDKLLTES